MLDGVTSLAGRPALDDDPIRRAIQANAFLTPGLSAPPGLLGPVLQAAADAIGGAGRPDLDQVLKDYQVVEDEMVRWRPNIGPFPIDLAFVESKWMTRTEAELLDRLGTERGLLGLKTFSDIASPDGGQAYGTADEYFPQVDARDNLIPGGEDGHNDAFRHAYWNALMTKHFGEDFAAAFGTAHEGVPTNPITGQGNPPGREAMDLFNNELGRRIAHENPDATDDELADLVFEAVQDGEAVVIDARGELAFSDRVAVGATGEAAGEPLPGRIVPPDYSRSN